MSDDYEDGTTAFALGLPLAMVASLCLVLEAASQAELLAKGAAWRFLTLRHEAWDHEYFLFIILHIMLGMVTTMSMLMMVAMAAPWHLGWYVMVLLLWSLGWVLDFISLSKCFECIMRLRRAGGIDERKTLAASGDFIEAAKRIVMITGGFCGGMVNMRLFLIAATLQASYSGGFLPDGFADAVRDETGFDILGAYLLFFAIFTFYQHALHHHEWVLFEVQKKGGGADMSPKAMAMQGTIALGYFISATALFCVGYFSQDAAERAALGWAQLGVGAAQCLLMACIVDPSADANRAYRHEAGTREESAELRDVGGSWTVYVQSLNGRRQAVPASSQASVRNVIQSYYGTQIDSTRLMVRNAALDISGTLVGQGVKDGDTLMLALKQSSLA